MELIPMQAIPRQSLSVVLEGNRWGIRVYEVTGCMACDFTLNDEPLINGVRAVADFQLLPYRYQQIAGGGNFAFYTGRDNTELPWWSDFGITCGLIYATSLEIAQNGVR